MWFGVMESGANGPERILEMISMQKKGIFIKIWGQDSWIERGCEEWLII